ncbi:hypothetical protein B484DRAFT_395448, partial [Ochromonadaceae sp. CCMP2298]
MAWLLAMTQMSLFGLLGLLLLPSANAVALPFVAGLQHFGSTLREEFNFRRNGLEKYREQIQLRTQQNIDQFRSDQRKLLVDARRDLRLYVDQVNAVYAEAVESLQRQRDSLEAEYVQSYRIDESLEAFGKFYNETLSQSVLTGSG